MDAKDAKKESSFRPELGGVSSGKPFTMRSIPFLRWTSPKLISKPKARAGLKALVWVLSLASLAFLA